MELWQQILGSLELPSTRMLLSQQARLVRLEPQRAVVQVAANWMPMVQTRQTLVEQAIARALGQPRQLVLEATSDPPAQGSGAAAQPLTGSGSTSAAPPGPATPPPPASGIGADRTAADLKSTPSRPAASAAAAVEPAPPAEPHPRETGGGTPLDERARRLADFFNGEVIELDSPLDERGDQPTSPFSGADAA